MKLRLTTWNLKWFGQLLQGRTRTLPRFSRKVTSASGRALQRLQRAQIAEEIRLIDPDILCIQEGPSIGRVGLLHQFCEEELEGRWTAIERGSGDSSGYQMRGSQGIWFLVRTARLAMLEPQLLPVSRWREATELESRIAPEGPGEHQKTWPVNHPWFDPEKLPPGSAAAAEAWDGEGDPPFDDLTERDHYHWRHPQVLVCRINGRRVDFVGLHLKSKFGGSNYDKAARARRKATLTEADVKLIQKVEQSAVESRIKLTTEVVNIRYYIDNRFRNEPDPAIFVLGDLNDGVGREYFERRYLFHDLISNLQGDVFFARRFLNHALFDYQMDQDRNYRWSVIFEDSWDPGRAPEVLLDHILFTQSVVGEQALSRAAVRVRSKAGRVEHAAHTAANAVFERLEDQTSDHRPVTVDLQTAETD